MRKATKTIISLAVILIAGLNFIVPAFAQEPFTAVAVGGIGGVSGAGLFGSMASASGIDIVWNSQNPDEMNTLWNSVDTNSVYFTGTKHEATGTGTDVYDYIEVDLADWLSAQTNFIAGFAQKYNVTDNTSGTITVAKSFDNIPLDVSIGNYKRSVYLDTNYVSGNNTYTFENGDFKIICLPGAYNGYWIPTFYYQGQLIKTSQQVGYSNNNTYAMILYSSPAGITLALMVSGASYIDVQSNNLGSVTPQTSNSWTSGEVDTSVFDGWQSAKIKIPDSISTLQSGWTLPDFLSELDRIWTGAGEDNIIIEDGGYVPPVPPTPVPSIPLGEVPFDDWVDLWGQGIYEQLENQSDALDFIGSNGTDAIEELESIDENIGALEETAESIDTNIGIGNGILGGIRSLAQSAVDYLEGIAEHVGELVEEIVEGTETLIAGILNQIPQVFSIIFGPIKQASSIWHYVVEWITSIGAPFQFIWSMASGTSYYIILPVYASLAASVVLAFYKRFGK